MHIVSGFIGLAGLLSIFTGLILLCISEKDHREFEFRLQLMDYHYKNLVNQESDEKEMKRQ